MSPKVPDTLDKALLDDTILPSSGFAASVMNQIAAEATQAAAPAPIPFPWKLALPTLAAALIALVAAFRLISGIRQSLTTHPYLAQVNLAHLPGITIANQLLPAIAATAGALLCLLLTHYLVVGRSSH